MTGNMMYLLNYIPRTPVEEDLSEGHQSTSNLTRRVNNCITPQSFISTDTFEVPNRSSSGYSRPPDISKLSQDQQDRATRKGPIRRGRRSQREFRID